MNIFHRRLLKKSFNRKLKLVQSMHGFQTSLSSATVLPEALVVINSESCQRSFPLASFCAPPSEVAELSVLSRCPFLKQNWFESADLHRIWFATCGFTSMLCWSLFVLREQWIIERLREEMSTIVVCNNVLQNPLKFHFQWKQTSSVPKI